MMRGVILAGLVGAFLATSATAAPETASKPPASFVPFEDLIGGWKGTGIPAANRLKGWSEKYSWAWKFANGSPVAMTVEVEGGKILTKAQLNYDPKTKHYRLEGTDPAGKPIRFVGKLDDKGRVLTLDRDPEPASGKERLTIRIPRKDEVRLVIWFDREEPGAPRFSRAMDIGLTKEGEAFAAGASVADLPKCIITGGSATMSVTYEGQTYPLCCTGCRDEFNENPTKYIKRALLRAEAAGKGAAKGVKSTGLRKDDGAFGGLVDEPMPESSPDSEPKAEPTTPKAKPDSPKAEEAEPAQPAEPKPGGDKDSSAKAAALLRQGQALEKLGRTAGALDYYRKVVKDHPETPQAKTAAARIKALGHR